LNLWRFTPYAFDSMLVIYTGNAGLVFLQQTIERAEIFRYFEILASALARACNCFSSIKQPAFDVESNISKSGNYTILITVSF
ncbi:hypothetical protein, partial [Salmonella enterica]|uniref:hypothetical protein n=1 Tax=Salmonella enterica TaxID=28901 RepID=UPI00397B82CF